MGGGAAFFLAPIAVLYGVSVVRRFGHYQEVVAPGLLSKFSFGVDNGIGGPCKHNLQ